MLDGGERPSPNTSTCSSSMSIMCCWGDDEPSANGELPRPAPTFVVAPPFRVDVGLPVTSGIIQRPCRQMNTEMSLMNVYWATTFDLRHFD
jgi:hypothetical protein